MSADTPKCGCKPDLYDISTSCLYPVLISVHQETEQRLAEAKQIIRDLIISASWAGSPEIKHAEEFLTK